MRFLNSRSSGGDAETVDGTALTLEVDRRSNPGVAFPTGSPERTPEPHAHMRHGQCGRAWKVSHCLRSPLSMPLLNQCTRCAEVPWVNVSGTT